MTAPGVVIFKAVIVGGVTLIFIVGAVTLPGALGVTEILGTSGALGALGALGRNDIRFLHDTLLATTPFARLHAAKGHQRLRTDEEFLRKTPSTHTRKPARRNAGRERLGL